MIREFTKHGIVLLFMVFISLSTFAQNKIITGRVVDENGNPVAGASVKARYSNTETVTDNEGYYTISFSSDDHTVVVSGKGIGTKEASADDKITVSQKQRTLNEAVVVGYGTKKSKDLTGSVVSIKAKDFQQGQVTTIEQLIQGKAAGVQITSNSGAPGSGSRVRIRGGSSLSGDNEPLYVIDGVPIDNIKMAGSSNPLNMINPNDIESIEILKDAAYAAIYGTRASNGVIVVTTKKGTKAEDRVRVSFSSVASLQTPNGRRVDMLNPTEFRELVSLLYDTTAQKLMGSDSTVWFDKVFRNAKAIDNNISITGGVKGLPYRLSFGYLGQEGLINRSGLDRYSGSLNLSPSFFKNKLKFNINLRNSVTKSLFADEGTAISGAYSFDPTQSVLAGSPDAPFGGYTEWTDALGNLISIAPRNPVGVINQRTSLGRATRWTGNIQAEFTLAKGLKGVINTGFDKAKTSGNEYIPNTAAQALATNGKYESYGENRVNKLFDAYLTYNQKFDEKHAVEVVAGHGYQDFIYDYPSFANYTATGIIPGKQADFRQRTLLSLFARAAYTYNDKYIFNASVRNDYTSVFANKSGVFPALSAAWRISEENFLKDDNVISNLKLRASWGKTGQQNLILNDKPVTYGHISSYNFSSQTALYQIGNSYVDMARPDGYDANMSWEKTRSINVGADFGLWNERLYGSIDLYNRKTTDLYSYVNIPAGSNFTNRILTNVGSLRNRGVEVSLNAAIVKTRNINWDFGVNYAHNNNKILSMTLRDDDTSFTGIEVGGISGGVGNNIQIFKPGYSINSFYVYQQVYDANGKPVENLVVDQNADGIINEKDRIVFKQGEPTDIFGFNSNLRVRKFSLGFIARAQYGNYNYNNVAANLGNTSNMLNPNGYLNNIHGSYFDTKFSTNSDQVLRSNYYIENAAFFKLDNINLGYNFGSISKTNPNTNLRFSAIVQNVFVITKYSGIDPEVIGSNGNGGIDNNFYPRPRIYSLGLNLNF